MSAGPATLLAAALDQLSRILRKEMALARAEAADGLRGAAVGLGLLVGAVLMALTALDMLATAALAWMFSLGLSGLLAPLAVAAGFAVLSLILLVLGRRALRLRELLPERTLKNIRKDAETIKEAF